ncbi:MAG: ECF transporter S component [Clostridiales bacterium]|nr:ECF transporter S component [Clostridiales bacterium]
MEKRKYFSAKRITGLAVLLALVIVLQWFGGYFKIGATSLSFVLVPIVLASVLYGVIAGGIMGLAFGVVVIIQGATGIDSFTSVLLVDHPVWTVLLCLVKGAAAGIVSGLLYKWIAQKNKLVGVFVAAASAPIVNTGLFILGALCFLRDSLAPMAASHEGGKTVIYFLVIVCAGINFLVEFAINLVLSPSIHTVCRVAGKRMR